MSAQPQSCSPQEKHSAAIMMAVTHEFVALQHKIHLPSAMAFLQVMKKPGLCISEYAALGSISQPGMSKLLADLGARGRYKKEGLGLIARRIPIENRRRREIYLTPKGEALATRLTRILKAAGIKLDGTPTKG